MRICWFLPLLGAAGCFDATLPSDPLLLNCTATAACPTGFECVRDRCVRGGEDVWAPRVLSLDAPSTVRPGAPFEVTVVADEPLAHVPVLTWSFAPTLVSAALDETQQQAQLEFRAPEEAPSVPASIELRTIQLTDVHGHSDDVAQQRTIVIDDAPPTIENFGVAPSRLSTVAGHDQLDVTFAVADASAVNVAVLFDTEELACTGPPVVACTRTITSNDVEGTHTVVVIVNDAAGLEATTSAGVTVDLSAPVDDLSIEVRASGSDQSLTYLRPLAQVRVSTAQRDATLLARLHAPSGATQLLDVAALQQGQIATLWLPSQLESGDHTLEIDVVDDAGNAQHVTQTWNSTAPEFGTCRVTDDAGQPSCTDGDGDGFLDGTPCLFPDNPLSVGTSALPAGDCDDDNPLTYPQALEIPGDGIDNSCAGGVDAPIDDTVGVFVSPDGDDAADGSWTAPVQTLPRAAALLSEFEKSTLFLLPGEYMVDGPSLDLPSNLVIVGLDSFNHESVDHFIRPFLIFNGDISDNIISFDTLVLAGIDANLSLSPFAKIEATQLSARHCNFMGNGRNAVVTAHDLHLAAVSVHGISLHGLFAWRSQGFRAENAYLFSLTEVNFLRSHVNFSELSIGSTNNSIISANSSIISNSTIYFNGTEESKFNVFGSVIRENTTSGFVSQLQLVNSVFASSAQPLVTVEPDVTIIAGAWLDAPQIWQGRTLQQLSACAFPSCQEVSNVLTEAPRFVDGFMPDIGSSVAHAGVAVARFANSEMMARDFDGNCRGAPPSIGAFEVP